MIDARARSGARAAARVASAGCSASNASSLLAQNAVSSAAARSACASASVSASSRSRARALRAARAVRESVRRGAASRFCAACHARSFHCATACCERSSQSSSAGRSSVDHALADLGGARGLHHVEAERAAAPQPIGEIDRDRACPTRARPARARGASGPPARSARASRSRAGRRHAPGRMKRPCCASAASTSRPLLRSSVGVTSITDSSSRRPQRVQAPRHARGQRILLRDRVHQRIERVAELLEAPRLFGAGADARDLARLALLARERPRCVPLLHAISGYGRTRAIATAASAADVAGCAPSRRRTRTLKAQLARVQRGEQLGRERLVCIGRGVANVERIARSLCGSKPLARSSAFFNLNVDVVSSAGSTRTNSGRA